MSWTPHNRILTITQLFTTIPKEDTKTLGIYRPRSTWETKGNPVSKTWKNWPFTGTV